MTTRQKLATTQEVAEHLCLAVHTLENWRAMRIGPRFIRVGALVRYRWADVDRWLDQRSGVAA